MSNTPPESAKDAPKDLSAYVAPSPQQKLMEELKRAQAWLQNPPEEAGWHDKERQQRNVAQILETYQSVERMHATQGAAPQPAQLDPALIEALQKREADVAAREERVSESWLASRFNTAAAVMATAIGSKHHSIGDIKAAFADKREELASMAGEYQLQTSLIDDHRHAAALGFGLIVMFPMGIAEMRSAKDCRKKAERILNAVDVEVYRWKLAQPKV